MGKNTQNRDLTGKWFGALKAVSRAEDRITSGGNKLVMWECECKCGRKKIVSAGHLRSLHTKSCGQCGEYGPSHELDDLTGREFGFLRVISRAEDHVSKSGNKFVAWDCECECGNHITVTSAHLKTLHTTSCGKCGKYDHTHDFTGERIGRLKVLAKSDEYYVYPNGDRDFKWICQCDCGNVTVSRGNTLRNKRFIQSCGCWRKEESIRDEDMVGKYFGICRVISRAERISVGGNATVDAWNCICKCGTNFVAKGPQLRIHNVLSCGCLSTSKWELWMSQYLDEHLFEYETQKFYPDLFGLGGGHLTYDFYLPKMNVLVECQGRQHYEPVGYFGGEQVFERQVVHDRLKQSYATDHDILLVVLNCSDDISRDAYFAKINDAFSSIGIYV